VAALRRLLVLGATGDLTGRYLLPALAELLHAGRVTDELEVAGIARDDWDTSRFRAHAEDQLALHGDHLSPGARDELVGRLGYRTGDVTDARTIAAAIADLGAPLVVYLALPPVLFLPVIDTLADIGLAEGSRVVVEKPFGTDLGSAQQLNGRLHECFDEDAVFRVDHFLGMQTVQNLLGLRFGNRVFEPLWCAEHIERVDIVWDETVGLEGRAGYYDETGALRDMVQNHLLQLLALTAMECPSGLDERSLRDAKVEVLRAVRSLEAAEVASSTGRARYTAGGVGDRSLPGYVDEEGVDETRGTETLAAVDFHIDNGRWEGVPFRLRTGKALAADRRYVRVQFEPAPAMPFSPSAAPRANALTMSMDPDSIVLDLNLNGSGDPFRLDATHLDLDLAPSELSPYARILLDAFEGNPALSIRDDEAEESWRIVEPILAAWKHGASPLVDYVAGSEGPDRD
jgi:glucose-6-phosphate 1-dehydrogenase